MAMVVNNAVLLVTPAPDSQYRLKSCGCGNDQPVYIQGLDGKWRVECLDCGRKTGSHGAQHDAQLEWNREVRDMSEQAKTDHKWEKAEGSFWKCRYQAHVRCADRNCAKCGWNPEVATARSAAILEKMGVTADAVSGE